ncbi:MAG: hypothetical protein M3N22_00495, partial [Acidobacteriota bacterium]|nr:hypothetical protein [Acidobacteriota bacterium]
KLHKLSDTTRDMKEWEKKHPEAEKEKSDRSLEEGTIAERAKAIEAKVPEVGAIMRKNGLTLHEYIVAFYVLMQASILVSMKKSSNKDYTKEETALVSPANLAFVEQHWDELQKMNQDPADKNKPSDKENE